MMLCIHNSPTHKWIPVCIYLNTRITIDVCIAAIVLMVSNGYGLGVHQLKSFICTR